MPAFAAARIAFCRFRFLFAFDCFATLLFHYVLLEILTFKIKKIPKDHKSNINKLTNKCTIAPWGRHGTIEKRLERILSVSLAERFYQTEKCALVVVVGRKQS